jgi:phosphoglycerate kinase
MKTTLNDLDVTGRTVAVRCDLNVPLGRSESGDVYIQDDGRIRACLPTLNFLLDKGARVVVLAHLGRPRGQKVLELSLEPVAQRLRELLGRPVHFIPQVSGPHVTDAVASLGDGQIALLENVRFDPRETDKDATQRASLAAEWATWADVVVSDGFGVVHREQASVTDLARLRPRAAGFLVNAERQAFDRVLHQPDRPYVVILGGAKVSDKIRVIDNLIDRVDRLLIGGGMAFTFLAAQGCDIGRSLFDPEMIDSVRHSLERATHAGVEILLPVDVVVAEQVSAEVPSHVVSVTGIPSDSMGLDIGPRTIAMFCAAIADARTIVWNGPMGVFELTPFSHGTRAIAEAVGASDAFSVVGGGDSAAAIRSCGIPEETFGHISTGGGASLELLEGRNLPGLAVLEDS